MLNLIQSVFSLVAKNESKASETRLVDPTVYQVETVAKHIYTGQIIYQDDVIMRLKCDRHMPVKILKTNIQKIKIMSAETV